VCISLRTTVVHNTALNSSDNFPSYPTDSHHSSYVVYWRGGVMKPATRGPTFTADTDADIVGRQWRPVCRVLVQCCEWWAVMFCVCVCRTQPCCRRRWQWPPRHGACPLPLSTVPRPTSATCPADTAACSTAGRHLSKVVFLLHVIHWH